MKNPFFYFSLLSLSSCAFFTNTPEYDKKNLEKYMKEDGFDRSYLEDIKKSLSRKTKMGGGIYKLDLTPYTMSLHEALVDDQAAAMSLTQEQKDKLAENLENKFLDHKTCFKFNYEVARIEKASQLQDWKFEVTDHQQITYQLKWDEESLKNVPAKSYEYIGSVREPVWFGEGMACSYQKIDLSENFEVKATVAYAPFPFSAEEILYWQYPAYEVIDGEKVEVKEQDKNFKGYRGW